ncbi:hypothetical protein ANCDUO_24570 [Ancylostoma duodenale]|uniref:IQ calmodulin-binding motif protein n=1 Tax=Ancylostoma duodenale TaxID=51022 RepID=A0A0C2FFH3_9BILA|nr:hypothetical protein ANCDUO_24570 [Ancylostoma duodenale]
MSILDLVGANERLLTPPKPQPLIFLAATRAFLAVRRLFYLQMHRAAIVIQTAYRRYVCESRYRKLRCAVVAIQAQYRAAKVRAWVEKMRYEQSAIIIQKYWRGYLVRRSEIERRRKIILVQCCVRRWLAKRRLRELKVGLSNWFSVVVCGKSCVIL